jgi:hypothetical protein
MNVKFSLLATAIVASFSGTAMAVDPPESPPAYDNGPTSFQVSNVNLSAAERAAYALYEGVMQVAEAAILATSCSSVAGSYPVSAFTNGNTNAPASNTVQVLSPGGSLDLFANLAAPDPFRGQLMQVRSLPNVNQRLDGVDLNNYIGNFAFNAAGTIMTADSSVNAKGLNGRFDAFQGKVIKDFYKGCVQFVDCPASGAYDIFDWGLQSVSKLGYPVDKYWQRSKSRRDDGTIGHTTFVKDRLVGSSSCRIVIDTTGSNNQDFFSQDGFLTVSTAKPAPAYAFFP